MTLNDLQKAALILFVAREVGDSGSLPLMRGIAYALRNRVKAGMHDGNWLDVIENADEIRGNDGWKDADSFRLTVANRGMQMLARDIDSIYFATGYATDEIAEAVGDSLYWQFINRPLNKWFVENIVRDPENHPRRTQIGHVVFFE